MTGRSSYPLEKALAASLPSFGTQPTGGIVPDGATMCYLSLLYWRLPVLHRLADDVRQVLFVDVTGSANEQPLLLHRAFDQVPYVVFAVAELAHAFRRTNVSHQPDQDPRQRILVGLLHLLAGEQLGDPVVPVWVSLVREPERGRRRDDDRPAVRHERVVLGIPRRLPLVLEACYGVGAGVRYVYTRRSEANASEGGPKHHRASGFDVVTVLDGAPEVLATVLQRPGAPHIRYRVRPLVGRPVVGALRLRAGVVGFGDIGLGGVADHVEATG